MRIEDIDYANRIYEIIREEQRKLDTVLGFISQNDNLTVTIGTYTDRATVALTREQKDIISQFLADNVKSKLAKARSDLEKI